MCIVRHNQRKKRTEKKGKQTKIHNNLVKYLENSLNGIYVATSTSLTTSTAYVQSNKPTLIKLLKITDFNPSYIQKVNLVQEYPVLTFVRR